MFMIESLEDAPNLLSNVYSERIRNPKDSFGTKVRGPVGLFFVPEDGANGSKLAQEVVGSYEYWDIRSAHHFDGIFLGWGYDAGPAYSSIAFSNCVTELEDWTTWQYKGGAHLILVDFLYDPISKKGELDFSNAIPLDLTDLLTKKKWKQLGELIEEIVRPIRSGKNQGKELSANDISDYLGFLRTRRIAWEAIVEKIGGLLGWVDDVASYAVRDLRR